MNVSHPWGRVKHSHVRFWACDDGLGIVRGLFFKEMENCLLVNKNHNWFKQNRSMKTVQTSLVTRSKIKYTVVRLVSCDLMMFVFISENTYYTKAEVEDWVLHVSENFELAVVVLMCGFNHIFLFIVVVVCSGLSKAVKKLWETSLLFIYLWSSNLALAMFYLFNFLKKNYCFS